MTSPLSLKLRIDGMDCASCALKIENAMKRLPGVSDIDVSYAGRSLSLRLDEDRTGVGAIERQVRALGFTPIALEGAVPAGGAAAADGAAPARWWEQRKPRLLAVIGAMFVVAAVFAYAAPPLARWAWSIEAGLALLPFLRRAWAGARAGTPFGIETLMSVAVIGALLLGAAEEAALVIVLFAVGEWLEGVAAGKARAGVEALVSKLPREALRERGDQLERVSAETLVPGDVVVVRPGDRIAADGRVIGGAAEVDESPLTGESVPVGKQRGDMVHAGSISTDGELRIEVTRSAGDTTLARVVRLVEQAQESKAPTARLVERFSRRYTPAAMLAALLVAVLPPLLVGASWDTWIYRGLATLLIACPCALVISTPAAIASGLAALARRGLLVKGGAALETLGRVGTVAFDKTGTLTRGRPELTDLVVVQAASADALLAQAAAVERKASHPLGAAIVAAAQSRGLELPASFGAALTEPGRAVTARLKQGFVTVGSPRHAAGRAQLDDATLAAIETLEAQGKTVVVVLAGTRVQGLIALRDEPRDGAAQAVAALRRMGVDAVMLTGDNRRTAEAIAQALQLRAVPQLLPEDKLAHIDALRGAGLVAMVGDGINDAPALAAASVGIAMGGGTDVALETADAALLRDDVGGVAELVAGSRATLANIRQNIGIALGLKAVFFCTTLLGLTSLWMAILADTGATVLVTANALRLLSSNAARRAARDLRAR